MQMFKKAIALMRCAIMAITFFGCPEGSYARADS